MNTLIPYDRLLEKQIKAEADRELHKLYQQTAGFQDPEPPKQEQVEAMETGVIEL